MNLYLSIYIYIYPPFNPGIFGGVKQEISETYFVWPHEIYHPTCFFDFQKKWEGVLRMPDFSLDMSIGYT